MTEQNRDTETETGHVDRESTVEVSQARTKDEPKAPSRKSTTAPKKDGATQRKGFVYPPKPTTGEE